MKFHDFSAEISEYSYNLDMSFIQKKIRNVNTSKDVSKAESAASPASSVDSE